MYTALRLDVVIQPPIFDFQWATRSATTLVPVDLLLLGRHGFLSPWLAEARRGKLCTGGEGGIQLTRLRIAGIAKPGWKPQAADMLKATINDWIPNKRVSMF